MPLELDARQRAMLQEMGVPVWLPERGLPPPPARHDSAAASTLAPSAPPAVRQRPTSAPGQTTTPAADWSALRAAVQACRACSRCAQRQQPTLQPDAEAAARCDWMVVGDPPDEEEDRSGSPFAGPDGVLLHNMLRAVGVAQAHRSNVLKCRIAQGAPAQPAELAQCAGFLQQEIQLLQPRLILSMGRFANQLLLCETPALAGLPLGRLRGSVYRYRGVPVVVTYAPKQLMRNGADKAKAWADLCLAAATLEATLDA